MPKADSRVNQRASPVCKSTSIIRIKVEETIMATKKKMARMNEKKIR